jgi:GH25 family lysozyme M1 (1,4-beta-N-acetylmuramidase)
MRSPKFFACLAIAVASFCAPLFTTVQPASASTPACKTWVHMADISSNNPHPINFTAAVKGGLAGIYIKVTQGTYYTNPYFSSDVRNSVKVGLPWGAYDFAQPSDNPVADAKYFVANGGGKGPLPPALDMETQTSSSAHDVAWAQAWLKEVKSLTGKTPIIYTGAYYWWSDNPALGQWKLWLAGYPLGYQPVQSACGLPLPNVPGGWKGWTIWQFTSTGVVPGIGGYTDLEAALPSWFKSITGAGVVPSTPKHPVPTPLYAPGSVGVTVDYVQKTLFSLGLLPKSGITGTYTVQTKQAVEQYQVLMGVPADGLWGPTTSQGNIWYLANHRPVETLANYPIMQTQTAYHTQVAWMQARLNKSGAHLSVDGVFSIQTEAALIKFQKAHDVAPFWYGTTDITTWRTLWSV